MPSKIPAHKTRLLLVEGPSDKEFFIRLGFHLQFTVDTPLHIEEYGGKDNLGARLAVILNHENFENLTHIGIVRDADYNTNAFESVRSALQTANRLVNINTRQFPIPDKHLTFAGESPKLGILILPDVDLEGMLEDVLLTALADDAIAVCVDDYFKCVAAQGTEIIPNTLSKAKIRVFIAGKNVGIESTGDDRNKDYLSDIYKMSWWTEDIWQHSAFDTVKDFLLRLVEDTID